MADHLDRYVRAVAGALARRDKRTRGRNLIIYVGRQDLLLILQHGFANGDLARDRDSWRFMTCELVEVRKDEWFELGWQGFVA